MPRGKWAGKTVFRGSPKERAIPAPRVPQAQTALPLAGDEEWVHRVSDEERSVRGGLFVLAPDGSVEFGTTGVVVFIPRKPHESTWVLYEPVPMTEAQRETLERLYTGWRPW